MPTMPANNWVSSAGVRLHRLGPGEPGRHQGQGGDGRHTDDRQRDTAAHVVGLPRGGVHARQDGGDQHQDRLGAPEPPRRRANVGGLCGMVPATS